jgi:hypothetical protein
MSRFSLGLLVAVLSAGMPGVAQAAAPADGASVISTANQMIVPDEQGRGGIAVTRAKSGGVI